MHVLTWLCAAVFLGANLLALVAIGAVLIGRAETATQRRVWAVRCAASAFGLSALAAVMCGVSIVRALPATDVEPSARATRLAMGISEVMNSVAFGVLGSAFPFLAAGVLFLLARRAAPPRN
jgi:uncharacterized membrane protein